MADEQGKPMKNYVISLTTATNRREHIKTEFGKQNIHFEFFDAVTPNDIEHISTQLNIPLVNNQRLSLGEKACFLSHVCLWQKMIDDDLEYVAIFEDDVYLGENAIAFLKDDWLSFPFDIIKLETWHELVHLSKPAIYHQGRTLHPLKSTHVGACGYVLHRLGATKLLDFIRQLDEQERYAIDHVLFGAFLTQGTVYQLNPALCKQPDSDTHLVSQLEQERKNNTFIYQPNDTLSTKIHKFFKRLYRSFGKRFFYMKVPFC